MSEGFSQSTESIIESLIQVFKHQNKLETVNILENAEAKVEETGYDNWDGGTFYYTLSLGIPLKLFAHLESRISLFEESVTKKLSSILRNTGNQHLSRVVIAPILATPVSNKIIPKPTEEDVNRIWQPNSFRLFLSHVSNCKGKISAIKSELEIYRISGFVAHEDIEPTKEWENEILIALNSAQALATFLTCDFPQSQWTDQEVGIALGRGLLVIPINIEIDPYGFMARKQAMRGSFEKIELLVIELVAVLLKNADTSKTMCEALVMAFEEAGSFINAKKIAQMITSVNNFTQGQLSRISQSCTKNYQIAKAFGVPERIENYLNKQGFKTDEMPL